MTRVKVALTAMAGMIGALVALPAAAQSSFSFDMRYGPGWVSSTGQTLTINSDQGSALQVKMSAWTVIDGSVKQARLGVWANGLGVSNPNDPDASPHHAFDNYNQLPSGAWEYDALDFVVLQFSQAVRMTGGTFTPYAVESKYDTDAVLRYGGVTGAWNQDLSWAGLTQAQLNSKFTGAVNSADNRAATDSSVSTRSFSTSGAYGNLWLVSATSLDTGTKQTYDAFKLSQINLLTRPVVGVPEPATWGMMILGFGLIGSAMRRRQRLTAATA